MTDVDIDQLPQLDVVFDQPQLDMQAHTWIQRGYKLIEQCHDHQAIPIPSGKMLVKREGAYTLIDE